MSVSFLDETPFLGTYVYPKPSAAYFTNYLAEKVLASPWLGLKNVILFTSDTRATGGSMVEALWDPVLITAGFYAWLCRSHRNAQGEERILLGTPLLQNLDVTLFVTRHAGDASIHQL